MIDLVGNLFFSRTNTKYDRVYAFVSQLLENEFLISELRPPLSNVDTLDHIVFVLSNFEKTQKVDELIAKVNEIKSNISKYNGSNIGDGLDIFNNTVNEMKDLYKKSKNYLQVDMKTSYEKNSMEYGLKSELESFVSNMIRLTPKSDMSEDIMKYSRLFVETYGYGSEIPILELLDIDKGLGSPFSSQKTGDTKNIQSKNESKSKFLTAMLNRKIINALREGERKIEITEDDISFIQNKDDTYLEDYIPSFELFLLLHQNTNDSHFTISPATIASGGIGKSFGRFGDMLTNHELDMLKDDFGKHKDLKSEYAIAEVSEIPSSGRFSNVSINTNDYDYEIVLSTNSSNVKHTLSIRDIYVGMDYYTNSFYLKSKCLNKRVLATRTSLINPLYVSIASRFMCAVSSYHKINPINAIQIIASDRFEYSPRISLGKVIIKPETWLISDSSLGIDLKDMSDFHEKLLSYRQKYRLPRHVFMSEYDNRHLLDLDNSAHRNEILTVLKKLKKGDFIVLTELTSNYMDYTAVDENGEHYITEVVVPFILNNENGVARYNKKSKDVHITKSDISFNAMTLNSDDRILIPGKNNWLYFKLYGNTKRQNEFLVVIYEKLETLLAEGYIDKYFFIRYSDSTNHIRLRIHFNDNTLSSQFMNFSEWIESKRQEGLLSLAVIDSYQREVVRYGGAKLIELAEAYFFNETQFIMPVISKVRFTGADFDIELLSIAYLFTILNSFDFSVDMQQSMLNNLSSKDASRADYRKKRKLVLSLMTDRKNWLENALSTTYPDVFEMLNNATTCLSKYSEAIILTDKNKELTSSIQRIVFSLFHMFCNRLIGDNNWEAKILAFARHGLHDYSSLVKHNDMNKTN